MHLHTSVLVTNFPCFYSNTSTLMSAFCNLFFNQEQIYRILLFSMHALVKLDLIDLFFRLKIRMTALP